MFRIAEFRAKDIEIGFVNHYLLTACKAKSSCQKKHFAVQYYMSRMTP